MHARDDEGPDIGLSYPCMHTVFSLVELTVYIVAILGLSMAATWAVIKISPSESVREQRAKQKAAAQASTPPADQSAS